MIVDRILDFKLRADEPPAAAQFLCSKLYNEFAVLTEIEDGDMMASSMGFAPDVVECAGHLYGGFLLADTPDRALSPSPPRPPPPPPPLSLSLSDVSLHPRALSISIRTLTHTNSHIACTDRSQLRCDLCAGPHFPRQDPLQRYPGHKEEMAGATQQFCLSRFSRCLPPTPDNTLPYPTIHDIYYLPGMCRGGR